MDHAISGASQKLPDFDTCVLSLAKSRLSSFPLCADEATKGASVSVPQVEPAVLIDRIARYCHLRQKSSFRLVVDSPTANLEGGAYLEELLAAIEGRSCQWIQIRPCLRSLGPLTYPRHILERLSQLQGSLCFEIPEQLPQHGAHFASRWVEAIRFASEATFGLVPLSVHAQASPAIAPATFLRELQRLRCASLDVLWPRHFSSDFPPWSGGFYQSRAEYSASPVYGQWFSDLFRLWWILDNPRLAVEGFARLVGRFDETETRRIGSTERAFVVTGDGEFGLPRHLGGDWIAGSVGVGLHVQAVDIAVLERLEQQAQAELPKVDVLAIDRRYFSEQVRAILAQDCYPEVFYAGPEESGFEAAFSQEGLSN